jgi:tyrosine-protein phosphatase YwqE
MIGLIKRFFEKTDLTPADLSVLQTDIHSHLLFGIDDGAENLDNSIQLIEELMGFGYKKFITTPHIMGDFYRNSPETILPKLEAVRKELADRKLDVIIEAAAEYYLDYEFEEKLENGNLLTFGGNKLLFELSFINAPESLDGSIFRMQAKGYQPVLAHPERYLYWLGKWDRLESLRDRGVWFQINLLSIMGHYGGPCKKFAEDLIDRGWVELLGSDLHNLKHIETFKRAISDKYLKKALALPSIQNSRY